MSRSHATPIALRLRRVARYRVTAPILLFVLALTFRATVVSVVHRDVLDNDEVTFVTLAANLANGHGLSACRDEPYVPYFLREPVYPTFLAGAVLLHRAIGHDVALPDALAYNTGIIPAELRPLTQTMKYAQSVVGSLNVLVLFVTLSLVIRRSAAFAIALLYALYYPSAVACAFLLREVLQETVILGFTYYSARYVLHLDNLSLLFSGGLIGLGILSLQAMAVLGPVFFAFVLVRRRRIWPTLLSMGLCALVAVAVVSPWVLRAYRRYSTWRVARSFGLSLTPEWMEYSRTLLQAKDAGVISEEEFRRGRSLRYAGESFPRSLNGRYEKETQALRRRLPESAALPNAWRKLKNLPFFLARSLANTIWHPWNAGTPEWPDLTVIRLRYARVLRALTLLGLCIWFRRTYPITIGLAGFFAISPLLMSEQRRIFPVGGVLFMYACLAVWSLCGHLVRRSGLERSVPSSRLHHRPTPEPRTASSSGPRV